LSFKLLSVLKGVKTVLEHSKDLVTPELDDVLFAFVEVLVSLIHTLEHLRDISHVEDVVALGRSRKEVLLNDIEEVNSSQGHRFAQVLDFLIEVLELKSGNSLEDLLHLGFGRDSVVDDMEL
jgi:hypothetical protein